MGVELIQPKFQSDLAKHSHRKPCNPKFYVVGDGLGIGTFGQGFSVNELYGRGRYISTHC